MPASQNREPGSVQAKLLDDGPWRHQESASKHVCVTFFSGRRSVIAIVDSRLLANGNKVCEFVRCGECTPGPWVIRVQQHARTHLTVIGEEARNGRAERSHIDAYAKVKLQKTL